MKGPKVGAWAAALVAAAGAGAALSPVAHGQAATVQVAPAPHAMQIFTGGSRIGVSIREVEQRDLKSAKLPGLAGAVIEDVADGSPAEKAGLRAGDVVLEFDGERVRGVRHLTRLVQETPDGREVQAVILRDGQRTTLAIAPRASGAFGLNVERFRDLEKLGREFSYNIPARPAPGVRGRTAPHVWGFDDLLGRGGSRLGITVDALSPQLAEYFGTKEGVLVTTVNDGSAAAKAGMKAGDVITAFNGATVNDGGDLRRQIQDLDEGEEFTISVMRDRKPQTLKGKLETTERTRRFRTDA
jgi:serine protease Do